MKVWENINENMKVYEYYPKKHGRAGK